MHWKIRDRSFWWNQNPPVLFQLVLLWLMKIIISLPRWDSSDGFSLRENFVNELNSPFAQKELRKVMHSGRGVFKGFKNVLKDYPLVEKAWHRYKNLHMREYIGDWYNQLREIWGLEKLQQEPEDNEDLLNDDFQFFEYSSSNYKELVQIFNDAAKGDFDSSIPEEIKEAEEKKVNFLLNMKNKKEGG